MTGSTALWGGMVTGARPEACVPCEMEQVGTEAVVFRDGLWACEVLPSWEVPGWVVMRVRRHAEHITSLMPAELATFGPRLSAVAAAVKEVTGAPTAYMLNFNEANPHFHILIAPRGEDVPVERRFGGILQQRLDQVDRPAALQLVPKIAAAYFRVESSSSEGAAECE